MFQRAARSRNGLVKSLCNFNSQKIVTCHKNDHLIDCIDCEENGTCFIKIKLGKSRYDPSIDMKVNESCV